MSVYQTYPRIYLSIVLAMVLTAVFATEVYSQKQRSQAREIVNFRFCCSEENSHCRPVTPKRGSQLFFVDNEAIITLRDIAAVELREYYHVPRYDLKLDKDGNEVATTVYFNDFRVLLSFTDAGNERIKEIFTRNPKKLIAVFLDKELVMILKKPFPVITGGALEVAGDFSEKEARSLVEDINMAIESNKKK